MTSESSFNAQVVCLVFFLLLHATTPFFCSENTKQHHNTQTALQQSSVKSMQNLQQEHNIHHIAHSKYCKYFLF